jgi:hypothetical protein
VHSLVVVSVRGQADKERIGIPNVHLAASLNSAHLLEPLAIFLVVKIPKNRSSNRKRRRKAKLVKDVKGSTGVNKGVAKIALRLASSIIRP